MIYHQNEEGTTMSDILIHFNDSLDPQTKADLEHRVRNQAGVRNASVSRNANHLLLVDYDHEVIQSIDILQSVQKRGFQAQLIGL